MKFKKGNIPWNKGKKMPKDFCDKISKIRKDNPNRYWLGRKLSEEHKEKMSLAKLGKIGIKANRWKGNDVGYRGLHYWVYSRLGRPQECKFCNKKHKKYKKDLHWANRSGKYIRNITDWISLCVKCHKEYDASLRRN